MNISPARAGIRNRSPHNKINEEARSGMRPYPSAQGLQLERIELREIELPLKHAFRTSFGVTTKRCVIVVRVTDRSGASGYGECTAMEQPFYNPETVDTARAVISNCIAPMLKAARVSKACETSGA